MKQYLETFMMVTLIIMIVAILLGLPLMILWNLLMPDLFRLPYITFWQAVGLNILASILFNKSYSKNS